MAKLHLDRGKRNKCVPAPGNPTTSLVDCITSSIPKSVYWTPLKRSLCSNSRRENKKKITSPSFRAAQRRATRLWGRYTLAACSDLGVNSIGYHQTPWTSPNTASMGDGRHLVIAFSRCLGELLIALQGLLVMSYSGRRLIGSVSLKGKHLVLELADRPCLLEADCLGGLLEGADHGRRAAEQDLDVVGGLGKPFLYTHKENPSSAS